MLRKDKTKTVDRKAETRTQKPEHSMTGQNSKSQNKTTPCRPARVVGLGHGEKDQHGGKRTGTAGRSARIRAERNVTTTAEPPARNETKRTVAARTMALSLLAAVTLRQIAGQNSAKQQNVTRRAETGLESFLASCTYKLLWTTEARSRSLLGRLVMWA